jgi:hypothetical protein
MFCRGRGCGGFVACRFDAAKAIEKYIQQD